MVSSAVGDTSQGQNSARTEASLEDDPQDRDFLAALRAVLQNPLPAGETLAAAKSMLASWPTPAHVEAGLMPSTASISKLVHDLRDLIAPISYAVDLMQLAEDNRSIQADCRAAIHKQTRQMLHAIEQWRQSHETGAAVS